MTDKICTNGHVFIGLTCDRCGASESLSTNIKSTMNEENTIDTNGVTLGDPVPTGATSTSSGIQEPVPTKEEGEIAKNAPESGETSTEATPTESTPE